MILTGALAQPLQAPLWLGPAAEVFSACPGQRDPAVRPPTRRRRWVRCRSLLPMTSAEVRCSSDDFASALTRAPAERGNSLLKTTFKALRRVSLCPWRIGAITAAALVLLHHQHDRTT